MYELAGEKHSAADGEIVNLNFLDMESGIEKDSDFRKSLDKTILDSLSDDWRPGPFARAVLWLERTYLKSTLALFQGFDLTRKIRPSRNRQTLRARWRQFVGLKMAPKLYYVESSTLR